MGRTPRHVAAAVFRLFSTVDLWPQLAEMAKTLPRDKLVNLEGYDYGIRFLAPQRCVKAVREFLDARRRDS